jgi:DNA polymerase-3 subunit beta
MITTSCEVPDGAQLEIETGAGTDRLSIFAGRSRFALQALPPEDFPDLAAGELSNSFTIAAADLRALIDKTRFAISTEETRYYLNGIYLHEVPQANMLRAVATDGHRLAQAQIRGPKAPRACPALSSRARPCSM